MVEAETGATVVMSGDELVGVITERDLLRCFSEGMDPATPVEERMTRHVLTAAPTTEIPEALALMVDGHFRHLPVVNGDGAVIGLVSMRDLMTYTSHAAARRIVRRRTGQRSGSVRDHRDDPPHAHRRSLTLA